MNALLTPSQRLIIPADFQPKTESELLNRQEFVIQSVVKLCDEMQDLGVVIKLNSALRILGYDIIRAIRTFGTHVFADLKLNDIPETLKADGLLLEAFQPEIVTVMCSCGPDSIKALCDVLTKTEVAGVTVLTSLKQSEVQVIHNSSIRDAILRLVEQTIEGTPVRTFVCSPAEVPMLIQEFGRELRFITPGIRPTWSIVKGDDQNPERIMTPQRAILAGSTKLVVGRPILNAPSRREAAERTIAEIKAVCLAA